MRQAGVIDDLKRAQRFADYLLARGIKSRVEPQPTGGKLWIYEDGQLEQARQELAEFNADPDNARYDRQREAQALREQERREQELAKQRMINVRTTWGKRGRPGSAPVSVTLIIVCIALHLLLHYGPATPGLRQFFNSLTFALAPGLLLQHLLAGEVWRLVTPVLLHGSLLHLGFNMLWLYSLGSQVETGRGTLRFLALVLAFSVVSNLTQYLWAGPNFLGMSGVVYGLFAYVWMQSRYMPRPDLWIDKNNAIVLMVWLVLCMTGLLGPIANAAHIGGLVAGAVAGSGPFLRGRLKR
jgi:GlpG protein